MRCYNVFLYGYMAAADGLEPPNVGIKIRCLTNLAKRLITNYCKFFKSEPRIIHEPKSLSIHVLRKGNKKPHFLGWGLCFIFYFLGIFIFHKPLLLSTMADYRYQLLVCDTHRL